MGLYESWVISGLVKYATSGYRYKSNMAMFKYLTGYYRLVWKHNFMKYINVNYASKLLAFEQISVLKAGGLNPRTYSWWNCFGLEIRLLHQ